MHEEKELSKIDKPPKELSRYEKDFEVIEILGTGNFGAVLKCRNRLDKEFYAVKQVKFEIEDTAEQENQLKEISMMAKLGSHKNIVRYFSSWIEKIPPELLKTARVDEDDEEDYWAGYGPIEDEGDEEPQDVRVIFIQMELSPGISMDKWLMNPERKVDPMQSLYIFLQIVDALNFVHNTGIIHRDLKPENILMEACKTETKRASLMRKNSISSSFEDGVFSVDSMFCNHNFERFTCKLADFGLATTDEPGDVEGEADGRSRYSEGELAVERNPLTRRKTTGIGTKLYAAPEQLSGVVVTGTPSSSRTQSLVPARTNSRTTSKGGGSVFTYDDKVDIFPLGLTLVGLFCPPCNTVEQYLQLNALRSQKLPAGFQENYPREAALALELIDPNPNKRPNAYEVQLTCLGWLRRASSLGLDTGIEEGNGGEVESLREKIQELEKKNEVLAKRVERLSVAVPGDEVGGLGGGLPIVD